MGSSELFTISKDALDSESCYVLIPFWFWLHIMILTRLVAHCPLICHRLFCFVRRLLHLLEDQETTYYFSIVYWGKISFHSGYCELKWIWQVLKELCVTVTRLIFIYCDNKATIYIAAHPIFHKCTKHIEINCHFIHDASRLGLLLPLQ